MNFNQKKTIAMVLVGFALAFLPFSLFAEDVSPTDQLRPTLDKLVAILSDPAMKGDENKSVRRAEIMYNIKQGFDFREMSRKVLGKTWNDISEEQREHFTELMTKLLENVYIGKLESYSGQAITFAGERVKGARAQVTTMITHEGAELPIHYIMYDKNGKWMVYDINIEGVSLVRNYMEQFKSILRTEKFDGLVKVIEDKNRSFQENGTEG